MKLYKLNEPGFFFVAFTAPQPRNHGLADGTMVGFSALGRES